MERNYEPTLIQRQIEMAVTNGRGYLEKDESWYTSNRLRLQMIDRDWGWIFLDTDEDTRLKIRRIQ